MVNHKKSVNPDYRLKGKLMKTKNELPPQHDVGIIVGRFQVHELHQAHIDLITTVLSRHKKVILFLGLAHTKGTKNNPLDFEPRKQMLLEKFPTINVLYIADCRDDFIWSKHLDEQIKILTGADQTVVLYGSRDSFISHYTGKNETLELIPEVVISGTEIRKSISKSVMNDPNFRAGAIWLTYQTYDQVYTTVDVAIFNEQFSKILLARKPDETKYRFVGGFATPNSPNFETDARREVYEETGLEISDPHYVGSAFIDDWRYRSEASKIKTILFMVKHIFGTPKASDDIIEVRWFDFSSPLNDILVPEHIILYELLLQHFQKQENSHE